MTEIAIVVGVVLGFGAMATTTRILVGPSVLDRLVGVDMLLSLVICGLGAMAAVTRSSYLVPVIVILSLLVFTGSVSVALFVSHERDSER